MKQRFIYSKRTSYLSNILISLLIFLAVFGVFGFAVSSMSVRTDAEEIRILESAVLRDTAYCYALEGVYPESLAYLEENYGLHYDRDKYFIDYQPMGSNIMPDITIIRKGGKK